MRGDGAVQYDGFEYNWFFRRHHWRPNVGHLNAGGWVRRRRWVRLMVKPAKKQSVRIAEPPPANADRVTLPGLGSTQPPSTIGTSSSLEKEVKAIGEVWRGDAAEDWDRCHALMKRVGRDGRRIELWKTWLSGLLLSTEEQALRHEPRPQQWTEDSRLMPSEADYAAKQLEPRPPPLEVNRTAIANVIRTHVSVRCPFRFVWTLTVARRGKKLYIPLYTPTLAPSFWIFSRAPGSWPISLQPMASITELLPIWRTSGATLTTSRMTQRIV
jgi:hypothetical protein